jgi:homoserine dehydrogenase
MSVPLRVGVAGLGTVGVGTLELLAENADLIAERCGGRIEVTAVSSRERDRDRGVDIADMTWHDDAVALAGDPDVDAVVELIGGSDGVALALSRASLAVGKPLVTANKAMLAHHGAELAVAAEATGAALGYEAAVAGGIPIIKALREGLAANNVRRVFGILNGTCNYILSAMRDGDRDFAEVLAEAQELGFAEADPSFDIDGVDTAHKLAILASVAFGCPVNFDAIHIEGIRHVTALDIDYAAELGFDIKLLGVAALTERGLEQRVHPCMVPKDSPIAHVDGSFNAVNVDVDFADRTMFVGRGAGAGPTASAVVADLIDIARGQRLPVFGKPAGALQPIAAAAMENHKGAYYIRLMVIDRPGVMADVTAALRDEQVSVEALLQRGRNPGDVVPVVLTTHDTEEAAMQRTLARIADLDAVQETPRMIRIEQL